MRLPWHINLFSFVFSFFLSSFLLFCLCEIFPSLPAKLKLNPIPYYQLKERYVTDPELMIRIRPYYHYRSLFGGDFRNFLLKPEQEYSLYDAQYDQDGFRNRYRNKKADAVFVGDSYVEFGLNADDTLTARFEKKSGLKTANYGIGWYGPNQYLEVFKRYGLRNHPQYAVFCFFEGNDIQNIKEYAAWKKGTKGPFSALEDPIWKRFFRVLKSIRDLYFKPARGPKVDDPRLAWIRLKGKAPIQTAFIYEPEKHELPEIAGELKKLEAILKEFHSICQAQGIKPVFLFIPSTSHIYLPYAEMPAVSKDDLRHRAAVRHDLENTLREMNKRLFIRWVSLTEPFEKAAFEGEYLYYPADTHWNSQGRQLAAEILADTLKTA